MYDGWLVPPVTLHRWNYQFGTQSMDLLLQLNHRLSFAWKNNAFLCEVQRLNVWTFSKWERPPIQSFSTEIPCDLTRPSHRLSTLLSIQNCSPFPHQFCPLSPSTMRGWVTVGLLQMCYPLKMSFIFVLKLLYQRNDSKRGQVQEANVISRDIDL